MYDFTDRTVVGATGHDVGQITDVISDPTNLAPTYLVVRVDRIGGEHPVPVEAVEAREGQLVVAVDRERMKSASGIRCHTP